MIITLKKPLDDVLGALIGVSRVAILGCGRCATTCGTGGEKEVNEMGEILKSRGFNVVHSEVVEAQCDMRLTRKAVNASAGAEVVIAMSCGSGASAISDMTDVPVVPSNDTMFLGAVKRLGDYSERCRMCGECTIAETMGVCVKTRCAKGLLHGHCGGSHDAKCEVEGKDCAWAQVVDRMRKAGSMGQLGMRTLSKKTKDEL
jgi:ferredoxin